MLCHSSELHIARNCQLLHGIWDMEHGKRTWDMEHGTWNMGHGTWEMEARICCQCSNLL